MKKMNLTPYYNSHTQRLTTGSLNCENHAVITVQCFEEIVLGNGHTYLEAYGHSIFRKKSLSCNIFTWESTTLA